MWAGIMSIPLQGSVSQSAPPRHELTSFAKRRGVSVILVGHVTKGRSDSPALAVVEHMVGPRALFRRRARATVPNPCALVKNRLPAECGNRRVQMTGPGAGRGDPTPSALFLVRTRHPARGRLFSQGIECTRPVLCELQRFGGPLASFAKHGATVVGWDGRPSGQ